MTDVCEQRIAHLMIKMAIELRRLKGLPEENNVTILYREAMEQIGVQPKMMSSRDMGHLPALHESLEEQGIKLRCPNCQSETYRLFSLCQSCQESEGGKYKTKLICTACNFSERSEKPVIVWLHELGVDFQRQTKKSLGIRTITDQGIR